MTSADGVCAIDVWLWKVTANKTATTNLNGDFFIQVNTTRSATLVYSAILFSFRAISNQNHHGNHFGDDLSPKGLSQPAVNSGLRGGFLKYTNELLRGRSNRN